jgi:hypothetical protein
MNANSKRSAVSALGIGVVGALQWRLMLLWVLITLLPTIVVALPLWRVLDTLVGHSVHAEQWATHFNGIFFADTMGALQGNTWIGFAFAAGALLALAISPFLAGMAVAGGRANRALSFGGLLQGGATEYGRMLRVLPLSLVPYGLVVLAARGISSVAGDKVNVALLSSTADTYRYLALAATLLCFVIAQAIVESARAQFIADITLRSALRALGRGFMQVVRRPFASLLVYLVITLVGVGLSVLIAAWRGRSVAVGSEWLVAFLIVQLGVVVVAWMRTARLLALAGLSSATQHRRRRTDFAPAL